MGTARYKIKRYTHAENKLKTILLNALVRSVLLCSIHLFPTNANANRTHARLLFTAHKNPYATTLQAVTQKPDTNKQIRNTYKIPTIESKLKVARYRMFENWKRTLHRAYLNNAQYRHATQPT